MQAYCERWLIDREGGFWRQGDPRLTRKLRASLTGAELATFAVTNLGYVGLTYSGTRLQVHCRPKIVSALTFTGLCLFLTDYRWSPIGLSVLFEGWSTRISPSSADLIAALSRLVPSDSARDSRTKSKGIVSATVPVAGSPLSQALGPLGPLATKNQAIDTEAFDRIYNGRWSIGHFDSDNQRYIFDHMGYGFTQSVLSDTLNDPEYAAWVDKSRLAALQSTAPIFESVDAVVSTSIGPQRLRYHRVMSTLDLGSRIVFSASIDDTSINLLEAS